MSYFFLFCLIAPVFGGPLIQQTINESGEEQTFGEPETPQAAYLGLSSGASRVVPNIKTSFSCVGKRYGYFADVDNNCQIFHTCEPTVNAKGEPVIYHFTKFCPNQTRFDQKQLACVQLTAPNLLACSQSMQYYPATEARFAEAPAVQVEQRESLQQIPEQRQEQITFGEQIPAANVARNEPIPQPIAQPIVQNIPQAVPQQVFSQPQPQTQYFVVRNVEPIPQTEVRNTEFSPLKTAQAVIRRNTEPLPQTQPNSVFVDQNGQPLQVVPQLYRSQPLIQSNIPLSQTVGQQVVRPAQNVVPLVRNTIQTQQQFIPFSSEQIKSNFRAVPQFIRTNVQPQVIQPEQGGLQGQNVVFLQQV